MTAPTPALNQLIDQYINYITVEKGLAPKTVEAYAGDLQTFSLYLDTIGITSIQDADSAVILKHIINLRRNGLGPRSRARNLVALRGFYRFLTKAGVITENAASLVDLPKSGMKLPDVLTTKQVDRLMESPDRTIPRGDAAPEHCLARNSGESWGCRWG